MTIREGWPTFEQWRWQLGLRRSVTRLVLVNQTLQTVAGAFERMAECIDRIREATNG